MTDTGCTPWQVRPEHESDRDLGMLRIKARIDAGQPVSWRETALVSDWVFELAYRNQVVAYDPDRGHIRVWRAPADGGGLISVSPLVGTRSGS
jgi:hypothetical protein